MRATRLDDLVMARRVTLGAPVLVPMRSHLEDMARFNRPQDLGFQLVDEVSRQCGAQPQELLRPIP